MKGSRSSDKTEIVRGKATDVRKDGGELAAVHAEPGGERGEILVNRRGRNPAARAGVVGAVDGERGKRAVGFAALDRAPDDKMMTAPAVIAALAVAGKRAAKIAGGEGGDARRDAGIKRFELFHRALKGVEALAQFREQIGVCADHHVVRSVGAVT